jgi:TRAP-type C4-dicarboxylate transport system permease small subunit
MMSRYDVLTALLFVFVFGLLILAGWHIYNAVYFMTTVIFGTPL